MTAKREFLDLCTKVYQGSVRPVDFSNGNSAAIAGEINEWVRKITNGRIANLVGPGAFSQRSRIALVNAIYFKGTWANSFDRRTTTKKPFYVALGCHELVETMRHHSEFHYAEDGKVQVLRMPYEGEPSFDMFVFLPKRRFGLADWLDGVDGKALVRLMRKCCEEEVIVYLPKWTTECNTDLRDQLQSLGIKEAFDEINGGDFSECLGNPKKSLPLYLSEVTQKAGIEVRPHLSRAALI